VVIDGRITMGPIANNDLIAIKKVSSDAVISMESGSNNVAGLRFRQQDIMLWTVLYRTWQNQNLHIYDEQLNDELMTFESGTGCIGVRNENPAYPLDVNGTVRCASIIETSDVRLKSNVETLTDNLDKVTRLRGVRYVWNESAAEVGATPGEADIGLLAQEVEAVFPELVTTTEGGTKGVNYGKLTAVLIGAVKELKEQNEALARRVVELEMAVRHDR
jgi:hypothetical protein